MEAKISEFRGKYRFLSNFVPVEVEYDGVIYPSVEHAYVAAKTLNPLERAVVLTLETAGEAKKFGKDVCLRADWNQIRLKIMEYLLIQKFAQEPFRQLLIDTGDMEIVEGNYWHDNFYGICSCGACSGGQNNLGRLIMKIRGELDETDNGRN